MSQPIYTATSSPPYFRECLASLIDLTLRHGRRADVILGMPGHDCRFHGICRVEEHAATPLLSPHICKGSKVRGWLLRSRANHCILLIEKGTLNASQEQYHFARPDLEISKPVEVTAFYDSGGDEKHFMRQGAYPLWVTKHYYMLYLPLTNQTQTSNHKNPYRYE